VKPRGWGRDGRPTETYVDGDDVECVPPLRACATPGCKGTTRDIGVMPKCKKCQPDNQWRLR
jgi:hypothetical protein